MGTAGPLFIREVRIQNYKSIGQCQVELKPLTLLVGRNGSGKSNFLDALRFVSDALRTSLEHAVRDRGGINEVRRKSRGHPTHFGVGLRLMLPEGESAFYGFRVGARPNAGFEVVEEQCIVVPPEGPAVEYTVKSGVLQHSSHRELPREIKPDRLYLTLASALPGFRVLYDALSYMGFYNLNPDRIRDLQDPDPGELLIRDGRNIASVIRRLKDDRETIERIQEYLTAVIPGIRSVESKPVGPKETLEFRQVVAGDSYPWRFLAANMSDGTLRTLGVLVAVFQAAAKSSPVRFIGIEEPEIAVHPGAAVKLMDALIEAQHHVQILVTTHSPDLLDHPEVDPEWILAVDAVAGETIVAPMKPSLRETIRNRLYTVGELLRLDQIEADASVRQATLNLFQVEAG